MKITPIIFGFAWGVLSGRLGISWTEFTFWVIMILGHITFTLLETK